MLLLYNILISLLWPLLIFHPQFRTSWRQRLGRFEQASADNAGPGLTVLINAVSAGEVVAISGFIRQLRQARPDSRIVLMTTTDSGQEMAQGKLMGELAGLVYFPLVDLPFVVRRYLDHFRPGLYITTESELWPNIQRQCQTRRIPVALVNGRIYLHNKRGLRGWFVRQLYRTVDLIVCQDAEQHDRFERFGLPPNRLCVSGNIKFDIDLEEWDTDRMAAWRERWGMSGCRVVVAGSTHQGEEELVIRAYQSLKQARPGRWKLILAPRHIERAGEVQALVQQSGLVAVNMSAVEAGQDEHEVVVVDAYGVLVDIYRLAEIVIMGGTFHPKVGGHNILEATALGKPVIVGPYVFSIQGQLELFGACDAILRINDAANLSLPLARQLELLAGDPQLSAGYGQRSREVTAQNRGSSQRAVAHVLALLNR